MKLTLNSAKLPAWLNEFVGIIDGNEKTAVKNVKNLPTVNWKDETFYVDFNNKGAILYNSFGNEVRMLQSVKSMEDVNRFLNENSVVASADGNDSTDSQAQTEPIELTADVDLDVEKSMEDSPAGVTTQDENVDEEFKNELERVIEEPVEPCVECDVAPVEANLPSETENTIDLIVGEPNQNAEEIAGEPSQSIEDVSHETIQSVNLDDYVTKSSYNRLLAKIKELETKIANISVKANEDITVDAPQEENGTEPTETDVQTNDTVVAKSRLVAAIEQQYARTDADFFEHDLNVMENEVKDFQESAELSQKVIDKEHELDLSNMNDRAKLNSDFLKELLSIDTDTVEITENTPMETEDFTIDETVEIPEESVDETVYEPVVVEEIEEVAPQEITDETVEDVKDAIETAIPDAEVEVVKDDEDEFEELKDKQFDRFSKQICPNCLAKKSLAGAKKVASVIGVVCKHCGKEYAVTQDQKVFFKK